MRFFFGRYNVKLNGRNRQVCKTSFMDTFQITKDQVETLQTKAMADVNHITDGRGSHQNHHSLPPNVIPLIDAHIRSFPTYERHYSKTTLNPSYLSSDLTLDRMFRDFVQKHQHLPNPRTHENLYRRRFRASSLVIGEPRTDTCKACDRMKVDLSVARSNNNNNLILRHLADRLTHLDVVDFAKKQMDADFNRTRNDPTYAVICVDLQQVKCLLYYAIFTQLDFK